jgi:hypothetical protein
MSANAVQAIGVDQLVLSKAASGTMLHGLWCHSAYAVDGAAVQVIQEEEHELVLSKVGCFV